MTLQAEKRLPRNQEVVVDRAMGGMAVHAVSRDIRMFENKGASLFGMTLDAGCLYALFPQQHGRTAAVGVVTIGTEYPPFI